MQINKKKVVKKSGKYFCLGKKILIQIIIVINYL